MATPLNTLSSRDVTAAQAAVEPQSAGHSAVAVRHARLSELAGFIVPAVPEGTDVPSSGASRAERSAEIRLAPQGAIPLEVLRRFALPAPAQRDDAPPAG